VQTEAIFENIADRIYLELEQAKTSIYIAVAWLTNRNLFNMLLEKAQQGITVQLMLSNDHINEQSYVDYSQLDTLNSAAYLIGDGKKDLMHNKFCVIDSNTVINGSYNWSYKAEKNHENILITKGDSVLAEQFIKQFKKIRNTYFDYQESIPDFPLAKIIKRLEILKNYVILEDIEDITRESTKLKAYSFQQDIDDITQALQYNNFDKAITLIDHFIKSHQALVIYNDVDINALKLEIRQLEHQLNAYDNEKIELDKFFAEFYHRHTNELGTYISRLLHLRKIFTQDNPEQYAEAVKNEEDYNKKIEIQSEKTIYELNKSQHLELKKAYRQASQICHPDRVNEDMKDIAQELFIQLNQAYKQNDLAEVQKILSELKQGMFKPQSETVSEKEQLKVILQTLRYKIGKVEREIIEIKESEDYQTISNITDWTAYFEEVKVQLVEEIDYLETNEDAKYTHSDNNPTEEPIFQEVDIDVTCSEKSNVNSVPDQLNYAETTASSLPGSKHQAASHESSQPSNNHSSHGYKLDPLYVKENNYDITEVDKKVSINNYYKPNSQNRGKEYWRMVLVVVTLVLIIIIFRLFYFG